MKMFQERLTPFSLSDGRRSTLESSKHHHRQKNRDKKGSPTEKYPLASTEILAGHKIVP